MLKLKQTDMVKLEITFEIHKCDTYTLHVCMYMYYTHKHNMVIVEKHNFLDFPFLIFVNQMKMCGSSIF